MGSEHELSRRPFQKGDRVRLSEFGREECGVRVRNPDRLGTIAHRQLDGTRTIAVRWDGRRTVEYYLPTYLELAVPELMQEATNA